MTRRTTTLLLALAWALSPAIGHTAEVGVAGLELIIVDKLASSGRSKVVFVAKDSRGGEGRGGPPDERRC